ncbi:hypothetical protein EDB80DRAFT_713076, partial [Ilyonectria destructans]
MPRNRRTQPAGERLVCMHARPPRSPTTNERAHRGPLPLPPLSSARLGLQRHVVAMPALVASQVVTVCQRAVRVSGSGVVPSSHPARRLLQCVDRQQPQASRTYTLQVLPLQAAPESSAINQFPCPASRGLHTMYYVCLHPPLEVQRLERRSLCLLCRPRWGPSILLQMIP